MKATSIAPKMPKSQDFIPVNPIHRIQLRRSLSANIDFILSPQNIWNSDSGNLGQIHIPKLTQAQLLLRRTAVIAIPPIILNTLVKQVKSFFPHIKKTIDKTADRTLKLSQPGSKKEAQSHQHENSSRLDKVPTGLFPKLALKPSEMYSDSLGMVTPKNGYLTGVSNRLTLAFLGSKDRIISGIDRVELRAGLNSGIS